MPRGRRGPGLIGTAVVVGGAAHMGAKSAQKNQQTQEAAAPEPVVDPTVELKKYKDLLDSGTITQEEFDAKKKELLNL